MATDEDEQLSTHADSEEEGHRPKPPKNEYAKALDTLTRLLAMRDHSRFELQTKLSRRFEAPLVRQLLEEAEAHGWLMPEDEIAARLAQSLSRRNKSQRYIQEQLRKRRLPQVSLDAEAELDKVRQLVERRFGNVAELDRDTRQKAIRYLKYRGFADRWILQVLK